MQPENAPCLTTVLLHRFTWQHRAVMNCAVVMFYNELNHYVSGYCITCSPKCQGAKKKKMKQKKHGEEEKEEEHDEEEEET